MKLKIGQGTGLKSKMKHRLIVILLLLHILLVACIPSNKTLPTQAALQSTLPANNSTATDAENIKIGTTGSPMPTVSPKTPKPTRTPEPTKSITFTPLPTLTPFPPYVTKQILLDYYASSFYSVYEAVLDDSYSKLVLYADGQLIVGGKTYKQKMLSEEEKNQFLSTIEAYGYYTVETNHNHDPSDLLYNFGDQYIPVFDATNICVQVKGNRPGNICVYQPYRAFLVPTMKSLLEFLDNYPTEGMTPYMPDRILLWVQAGRDLNNNDLPENAIIWPKNLPSLWTVNQKIMFADGQTAKEIYNLFDNEIDGLVFTENNTEYTVYPQLVLPHEEINNEGQ